MPPAPDTIFALSSGRPPAAIAVIRISGPRAGAALEALIGRVPAPRTAALARVRDPATTEVIDEALALWFPGPASETGEDTAELQLHGGRAVIAGVVAALGRIEGLRPAEAGEFTRRAFENGRLDLTAVEGLADLIGAETAAQRRQAYRQMKGLLGDRAEAWRLQLIEALALVEARIDFSDEADVPEDLIAPALEVAAGLRDEIAEVLKGAARGERLRDGLVVAIAGPPNAGKSTLLNRIARREAAIVSPHAGTTRDVIEVHLDLDGYPATLLDTAGIRDSDDPVEQEGVRRARERAASADLVLWVEDANRRTMADAGRMVSATERGAPAKGGPDADRRQVQASGAGLDTNRAGSPVPRPPVWVVWNKIDTVNSSFERLATDKDEGEFLKSSKELAVSALTGEGVNHILDLITRYASRYFGSEPGLVSRERHRRALVGSHEALDRALAEGVNGREDIIAEELRLAARALGRLTGRVDVEDILDAIFRDFCIGK
jgi:tRNA modification GTPase